MMNEQTVNQYLPLAELVPDYWQTGKITTDEGVRIHYTRTGKGKTPVVLLHGVQVDGLCWLRTAQALEDDYDLIMPDLRGHGHSSRVNGTVSAEAMVTDVIKLINALELDSPAVIGHSMGADIAGRLAAAHLLRALVLVDPALQDFAAAPMMDTDNPPPWMQSLFDTLHALKTLPHDERMVAGLKLMPPGRTVEDERDYVAFIDGQARFDVTFYRSMGALGYLFKDTATIKHITCPTLLLTAQPAFPGADITAGVAAFMDHLPQGQHMHFADSGHAIMFDQLDRFVAVVREFLQDKID